jgi:hypothetical protein
MASGAKAVRDLLTSSGWTPTRRVDISAIEDHHARAGYPLSPPARRFLGAFAGLTVRYLDPQPPPYHDVISFLPLETAAGTPPQAVRSYEARVEAPLTIIGSARSNHLTLMMDDQGRVYGGYDKFLARYGNTGREAIETLVLRKQPQVID